jgi:molybdopterin-binding protein
MGFMAPVKIKVTEPAWVTTIVSREAMEDLKI